jgi:hypothetical protein
MTEQALREAHQRFRAALREQPDEPTAQRPATTTRHRPRCTRPGWAVEDSHTLRAVQIARCVECEAIELRTTTPGPEHQTEENR